MRKILQDILVCPKCGNSLKVNPLRQDGEQIIEGKLSCNCGMTYPVINTIPRILRDTFENESKLIKKIKRKTQKSFGYQWTKFSKMYCDFRENFSNYIWPIRPSFFKGKLGLDAGCGFGRHIYNAATYGAEMVGIDVSEAINSSYENTKHLKNVHLIQADIYNLPIRKNSFDFVYSIGVLHHLPDPEKAFRSLLPLLKPKGMIFVWVYSNKRKITTFFLELARKISTRLPFWLLKYLCFLAAGIEWIFFIFPYKALKKVPLIKATVEKMTFPHIKLYHKYPFEVIYADWFDRLSAPIRFYYDSDEIKAWFERADLKNVFISPTGHYGWRAKGEKV